MKSKNAAYAASRTEIASLEKKDSASALMNREASDIVFELISKGSQNVKTEVFVNSRYLASVLVIIPKDKFEEFVANYENVNELIVPGSFSLLGELYDKPIGHLIVFDKVLDDIVLRFKEKYSVTAKKLVFSSEEAQAAEARKKNLQSQHKLDRDFLISACIESFKEAFVTLAHLKVLKVVVDACLTFGSFDNFNVVLIAFDKGKESKVIQNMIKAFAEKDKMDLYGTKEQLNDTEDFYPFVYTTFQINI